MQTKVQEFLTREVGQITKYLIDNGFTMDKAIEEIDMEDSYQIEAMAMYHCPGGRELQDFIHHSRWGQKIKRDIRFLILHKTKIEQALNKTKKGN